MYDGNVNRTTPQARCIISRFRFDHRLFPRHCLTRHTGLLGPSSPIPSLRPCSSLSVSHSIPFFSFLSISFPFRVFHSPNTGKHSAELTSDDDDHPRNHYPAHLPRTGRHFANQPYCYPCEDNVLVSAFCSETFLVRLNFRDQGEETSLPLHRLRH